MIEASEYLKGHQEQGFGSREVECFLEHFPNDEIENFDQYYVGSYDTELDLIYDLLSEIENHEDLLNLIYPYLNDRGVLLELAFRNGLIIHEDFDYIVFKSKLD
ncbi:hypothetical protein MJH12_02225 [bacterium]|nr:hypothetical protein [bacterium]